MDCESEVIVLTSQIPAGACRAAQSVHGLDEGPEARGCPLNGLAGSGWKRARREAKIREFAGMVVCPQNQSVRYPRRRYRIWEIAGIVNPPRIQRDKRSLRLLCGPEVHRHSEDEHLRITLALPRQSARVEYERLG